MLKEVNTEEYLVQLVVGGAFDESLITRLADVILKQQSGDKVVTKLKVTRSGTFLNIYTYDKKVWKYVLTDSIKVSK